MRCVFISAQSAVTHSFVMLFDNAAARAACLPHPAHAAAEAVVPRLTRVVVCDHEVKY